MQPRVYATPRTGVLVRNPETGRHLPPAGESVPDTTYWLRRAADGDVELRPLTAPPPITKPRKPRAPEV